MNACFNRAPFAPTYPAQDGWNSWARRIVDIEFRGTEGCVYSTSDLGVKDKGCIGCSWRANGQADTGAGVAEGIVDGPAAGLAGVREEQGGQLGGEGAGGLQDPPETAAGELRQDQARAAEELEAIHPAAAIYRRSE